MCFEWGSEVVVGGKKAEKIGVGRVEDRGLIAMVRTDLWNKGVGEAWEVGLRSGWKE